MQCQPHTYNIERKVDVRTRLQFVVYYIKDTPGCFDYFVRRRGDCSEIWWHRNSPSSRWNDLNDTSLFNVLTDVVGSCW